MSESPRLTQSGSLRHENGICPITGKPMTDPRQFTWTDHAKPGVYNSCLDCCPNGPSSAGELLHATNERRGRGR